MILIKKCPNRFISTIKKYINNYNMVYKRIQKQKEHRLSEALHAITNEEMRTGNNLTPCSLCVVSLLCNIAKEERKKYTKYQLNMFELSICSSATFEE